MAKRSAPKHTKEDDAPHQPRPVRIPITGIPIRISTLFGQLLSLSATGASVQTPGPLDLGGEFSLVLHLPDELLRLKVRVVRAEPLMVDLPGATWVRKEYLLGVVFTDLREHDTEAIARLCGEAFDLKE